MLWMRTILLALLILLSGNGLRAAHAVTRVPDPGFAFVDVNNDGLYSVADKDIGYGSSPSVDINTLITQDGAFDTTRSEGAYRAPYKAVSLVIPASQTLAVAVPMRLKAGFNLIVHGTLNAPSLCLQSGKNMDLTSAQITFDTSLSADSGCNATLTAATITGNVTDSQLCISACGNIYAYQLNGFVAALTAGQYVGVGANGTMILDGASFASIQPAAQVEVVADSIQATNFTSLFSFGEVSVRVGSSGGCGNGGSGGGLSYLDSSIFANTIAICAQDSAMVNGSAFYSSGNTTIQSGGLVTGSSPTTAFTAAGLSVSGNTGIEFSTAGLNVSTCPCTLTASNGPVTLTGAFVVAGGGVDAQARRDINLTGTSLLVDHFAKFTTNGGKIRGMNSFLGTYTGTTDTYVSATASSSVDISGAQWSAPVSITLKSTSSNVSAIASKLTAALIKFYAGGGTINVTNAMLTGMVTYSPNGVTVLGP